MLASEGLRNINRQGFAFSSAPWAKKGSVGLFIAAAISALLLLFFIFTPVAFAATVTSSDMDPASEYVEMTRGDGTGESSDTNAIDGKIRVGGTGVEQFVTRLYSLVLDRNPDSVGFGNQVASLAGGTSAAEVSWGFFGSPEFMGKPLTNEQRVEVAYRTMLDRSPDAAGKAEWTRKLDAGMSMRSIISGFADSPEFKRLCSRWGLNPGSLSVVENRDRNYNATAFVSRLYSNVLGRAGDAGGLNAHTGGLFSGTSAAEVSWGFFGSPEFMGKPLTNEQRVEVAYRTMLDRSPDAAGKAEWTRKLNAGMSVYLLIAGFSDSQEFQKLCRGYGISAGRLPHDPAEISKYDSTQGGTTQPPAKPEALSVTIDHPQTIKCGEPTTFTFNARGGNGNYQFMPYSLMVKNGNNWEEAINLTYESYTTKNTFEYGFIMSGNYRFTVAVIDPPDNYRLNRFTTEFTISADQGPSPAERAAMAEAKANEAWASCQEAGCSTDYEKAIWLHDWVIENCEYDYDLIYCKDIDLFANGKGTCEAYHAAYMKLLKKAGIDCGRVYDAGHVWTLVKIDGEWCHIDTTHDDSVGRDWFGLGKDEQYLYFGLTDEIISQVLALSGGEIKGKSVDVDAASLESNYFIKSGRVKHYSGLFLQSVQTHLNEGAISFELAVPTRLESAVSDLPAKHKAILYSLVAYDLSTSAWTANGVDITLSVVYRDGKLHFSVVL